MTETRVYLTAEQFLSGVGEFTPRWEDVPIPELGENCVIRMNELSPADSDRLTMHNLKGYDGEHELGSRTYGIALSASNERGDRLFKKPEHVVQLARRGGAKANLIMQRMHDALARLQALTDDTIEDAAKNSESDPN
tara:strand:+ start:2968 stop:3378 length:411 start_codon:yes stop_codon:yes gene_type:complete